MRLLRPTRRSASVLSILPHRTFHVRHGKVIEDEEETMIDGQQVPIGCLNDCTIEKVVCLIF